MTDLNAVHTVEVRTETSPYWQIVSEHDTLAKGYARMRSEIKRAERGAQFRLTSRVKGARRVERRSI